MVVKEPLYNIGTAQQIKQILIWNKIISDHMVGQENMNKTFNVQSVSQSVRLRWREGERDGRKGGHGGGKSIYSRVVSSTIKFALFII